MGNYTTTDSSTDKVEIFELFLLKENLPEFLNVWINLNKPINWYRVKPLSLIIPRLKRIKGRENKSLPPKANKKANKS